jgi:hypothetical protein
MSTYGYETRTTTDAEAGLVEIRAYGGNRRQRGSKIGAEVRRQKAAGKVLVCYHREYSEGHGFMSMSVAKYRVAVAKTAAVE